MGVEGVLIEVLFTGGFEVTLGAGGWTPPVLGIS